jgi:bifunctional oligoribonuclease and PAP phosphatase NrnA
MTVANNTRRALHRRIWDVLTDGTPVVVTCHARADGDAAGSVLALCLALRGAGAEAHAVLDQPVPPALECLPGMATVKWNADGLPDAFTLVVLDCGEFDRIGDGAEALTGHGPILNIDHHISNVRFGDIDWVEAAASSTGEMLYLLLRSVQASLTRDIAECLFAAVGTDTGMFAFENTTPAAHELAAECLRLGVRTHELAERLLFSESPAQFRLRTLVAATLELHADGRLALLHITREMFQQSGLGPVDTGGLARIPMSIQGVEAGALLKQMPDGEYIKISMRSRAPFDVCRIARQFGGGGHARAAGCEMPLALDDARNDVLAAMRSELASCTSDNA